MLAHWYQNQDPTLTFSELSVHLSSQNVEQVGRRGHVRDLHIAVLVLPFELVCRREDSGFLIT